MNRECFLLTVGPAVFLRFSPRRMLCVTYQSWLKITVAISRQHDLIESRQPKARTPSQQPTHEASPPTDSRKPTADSFAANSHSNLDPGTPRQRFVATVATGRTKPRSFCRTQNGKPLENQATTRPLCDRTQGVKSQEIVFAVSGTKQTDGTGAGE
jgi:hypothetical protein